MLRLLCTLRLAIDRMTFLCFSEQTCVVAQYGLHAIVIFLYSSLVKTKLYYLTQTYSVQFLAASVSDKGRIVAVNADNCPLCAHTMRIFTAAYGAEAGVAGLKWLPYGGMICHVILPVKKNWCLYPSS